MLNKTYRTNRLSPRERAAFPTDLEHQAHVPDGVSPEAYANNRGLLSFMMLSFMTHRLRAMYQAYDGDLTLSLVLGEIAVRNYEHMYSDRGSAATPGVLKKRPCNALSISDVTGIPRETVRRKLTKLLELGWIEKTPDDLYVVSDSIGDVFAAFDDSQTYDLLATSRKIESLLARGR